MPAIKKAFDSIDDDIVNLTRENESSKKMGPSMENS